MVVARCFVFLEMLYVAGLSSVMDLLDVRRQLLAARQEQAEARRRQLAAVVQLCKALGGGWTEQAASANGEERALAAQQRYEDWEDDR